MIVLNKFMNTSREIVKGLTVRGWSATIFNLVLLTNAQIVRDETKLTELVEFGWKRLAPLVNTENVAVKMISGLESNSADVQPYDAGNASLPIANGLVASREL